MNISILGGGAFGGALAIHLAKKDLSITMWEFFEHIATKLENERVSDALPGMTLSANIHITSDLEKAVKSADVIIVAIPSEKIEETFHKIKPLIIDQKVIICSKGFTSNHKSLTTVVSEILKETEIFYLSGPTIALELAKGSLCGMVLASQHSDVELINTFKSDNLKIEFSTDIIGCELGAALKNVINIIVGITEGLELGENTKAYIFTKGLEEIANIGVAMGAHRDTFYGLTCMGDLTLNSRNRNVGIRIGKGETIEEIQTQMGQTLEGLKALEHAKFLKESFGLHCPIIDALDRIVHTNSSAAKEIAAL